MKPIFLLAALLAVAAPAARASSPYAGKLDIGKSDPAAIAFRELHDGMWLVGAQQQLWHLQNTQSNREVLHISGYWATRLEGQDTAYGPSIGMNVGESTLAMASKVGELVPELQPLTTFAIPPFVSKLSEWTSIEVYGGYRPVTGADDSHWIYGIGGKVTIPMSMLYAWASGTQSQGTGVKGL